MSEVLLENTVCSGHWASSFFLSSDSRIEYTIEYIKYYLPLYSADCRLVAWGFVMNQKKADIETLVGRIQPDWMPDWRRLIDEAPVGICWADATGQIKYANERFARFTGLSLVELTTKPYHLCRGPAPVGRWVPGLVSACDHPDCRARTSALRRGEEFAELTNGSAFSPRGAARGQMLVKRKPDISPSGQHLGTFIVWVEFAPFGNPSRGD